MRFLGCLFLLIALLSVRADARSLNVCANLFAASNSETTHIQSKTVERINRIASRNLDQVAASIIPDQSVSENAQNLGRELVKERALYLVYREDRKRTFSNKLTLELGDSLIESAIKYLDKAQISYRTESMQFNGIKRNIIVINPEGTHSLNKEAKSLHREHGTKVIYDPYELLKSDAEAMFMDSNQLLVSELMMANGSIFKDAIGVHELVHLFSYIMLKNNISYAFYGGLTSIKGTLPGRSRSYSKYQSLDEIDAMLDGAKRGTEELMQILDIKNKFKSEQDTKNYKGMILHRLRHQIENGLMVSKRLQKISLENLRIIDEIIQKAEIHKLKKGVWSVAWEAKTGKTLYEIEIPLIISKSTPTPTDFKNALQKDLDLKQRLSTERIEIFKSAQQNLRGMENITIQEALPTLYKLQELLSRH